MSPSSVDDDEDGEFEEDMGALRRACLLTGINPEDVKVGSGFDDESDENDDLEFVRSIQQKLSLPQFITPLSIEAPSPLGSDYEEDDYETLLAIERRFAKYERDTKKEKREKCLYKDELFCAASKPMSQDPPSPFPENRKNAKALCQEFLGFNGNLALSEPLGSFSDTILGNGPSGFGEHHCLEPKTFDSSVMPLKTSGFPESARYFIEALKKNRSCQKFIRSKMMRIDTRIEENKQLKGRVKCLIDFQVSCRRRAGRILHQEKDARCKLISLPRDRKNAKKLKSKDANISAFYHGPEENSHVSNYKMVLSKFPVTLIRQRWTKEEQKNLADGVKQQIQEMLLRKSMNIPSVSKEFSGDPNLLDKIIESIANLEITPENTRSFLPQVDWERLASMYVKRRSGVECEARWLNVEDPMINRNPWTKLEDKRLLCIAQQTGIYNWIDIAIMLQTNRTPSQCLSRYQRSLNAYILKKEWSEDEDAQLRELVDTLGENDWQLIASNLEGRTGVQCSNRWRKTLHPCRRRVGRWTVDEDKRLKIAVMLFGPKTWKKIAHFVSGRTQVQCRERWLDVLDPSLKLVGWTEEEDSRLKAAIAEHGHCWSKVAACVPPRTDSQCRRRWKVLLPEEVPLLQMARKIKRSALISNFVGRSKERPAIGPNDFLLAPETNSSPEAKNRKNKGTQKKKSRNSPKSKKRKGEASCDIPQHAWSKRPKSRSKEQPNEISITADADEAPLVSDPQNRVAGTQPNIVNQESVPNSIVGSSSMDNTQKKRKKSKPRKLGSTRDRCEGCNDIPQHASSKIPKSRNKNQPNEISLIADGNEASLVSDPQNIVTGTEPSIVNQGSVPNQHYSMNNITQKKRKQSKPRKLASKMDQCEGAVDHISLPSAEHSALDSVDINCTMLHESIVCAKPSLSWKAASNLKNGKDNALCDVFEQPLTKKTGTLNENQPEEISMTTYGDGALATSKSHNSVNMADPNFADEEILLDRDVGTYLGDNIKKRKQIELVSGKDRCSEMGGDHMALPHQEHPASDTLVTNGPGLDGINISVEPSLSRTISLKKLKQGIRKQPRVMAKCLKQRFNLDQCGSRRENTSVGGLLQNDTNGNVVVTKHDCEAQWQQTKKDISCNASQTTEASSPCNVQPSPRDELPVVPFFTDHNTREKSKDGIVVELEEQNEVCVCPERDGLQNGLVPSNISSSPICPSMEIANGALDKESDIGGVRNISSTSGLAGGLLDQLPPSQPTNLGEQTGTWISGDNLLDKKSPTTLLTSSSRNLCGLTHQDDGANMQRSRRASRRNINYKDMVKGIFKC